MLRMRGDAAHPKRLVGGGAQTLASSEHVVCAAARGVGVLLRDVGVGAVRVDVVCGHMPRRPRRQTGS
jgi:hypothetical protein